MAPPLPLNIFPGFTGVGLVSKDVIELATVFNAEGLDALSGIPEPSVAWADVGTRVTPGMFLAKVPVRLTSLLGFEPFEGERKFHQVNVASVSVKVNPWSLGLEWPAQIGESGLVELERVYAFEGIGQDVVDHARAHKADLVASAVMSGFTNVALGVTATALTLAQPGLPNGLPLFSTDQNGGTGLHYSNPLVQASKRFANLYYGVGKFQDYFAQSLVDMTQVPHASKLNMTLGLGVTDVVGPTWMLIPFFQTMIATLGLQTQLVGGTAVAGATTNTFTPQMMAQATAMTGVRGLAPWTFHIAPQLDAHPYCVANPGKHMWLSVSQTKKTGAWCELAGPSKTFAPRITLLGDGSEEARKTRKIRMFGDIDGGAAAGLPHFVKQYFETTPS